jgi:hypothetical protein
MYEIVDQVPELFEDHEALFVVVSFFSLGFDFFPIRTATGFAHSTILP